MSRSRVPQFQEIDVIDILYCPSNQASPLYPLRMGAEETSIEKVVAPSLSSEQKQQL